VHTYDTGTLFYHMLGYTYELTNEHFYIRQVNVVNGGGYIVALAVRLCTVYK